MPPPSIAGEVYCFTRRQLIFSFGKHVISFERSLTEHSEIDSVLLSVHDLQTNSWTSFLFYIFDIIYQWICLNELYKQIVSFFQISYSFSEFLLKKRNLNLKKKIARREY